MLALRGYPATDHGADLTGPLADEMRFNTHFNARLGRPPEWLAIDPAGYVLRLPRNAVDAWEFEGGLRAARAATGPAAVDAYDRVLSWWRGRAFDEFADGFAAEESARLEELRVAATAERLALLS